MSHSKRYQMSEVNKIYKRAYRETYPWDEILAPNVFEYFLLLAKGFNCPITVAMAGMLPLCSAVCGPSTKMLIRDSYTTPLNLFTMGVAASEGGKSYIHQIVSNIGDAILDSYGKLLIVESFSSAGLRRHQLENDGLALLCSDDGYPKLWEGRWDSTRLKDGTRSFKETSFSMATFIRPALCLSEISAMATEDGFIDKILFMVDKPKHYRTAVNLAAVQEWKRNFPNAYIENVFKEIFCFHANNKIMYQFDEEAQEKFKALSNRYADDFSLLYPSDPEEDLEDTQTANISPSPNKDQVISRVAVLLHILQHAFSAVSEQERGNPSKRKTRGPSGSQVQLYEGSPEFDIPRHISEETLRAAETLTEISREQKKIFLEAISAAAESEVTQKESEGSVLY